MSAMVLEMGIIIVVILLSMTLHEAMHAFMGYFLGDNTAKQEGRLTLNPIKHIDPFMTILLPIILILAGGPVFGGAKPVPFNPNRVRHGDFGAALVAIAGPLTNLFIAFLVYGVGVMTGVIVSGGLIENSIAGQVIWLAITVNLGFFVFNMLPIPPLDGSRLLYALAPEGARRVMEHIERYGIILIFVLVMLFSGVIGSIMTTSIQAILAVFVTIFSV